MNSTDIKHLSPWRVLSIGTLLMIAFEVIGFVLAITLSGIAAFLLLLVGFFVGFNVMQKYIKDWAGGAAACGFLAISVIIMGNAAHPIWSLVKGEDLPVVELPNHEVLHGLTGYNYVDWYDFERTGGRGHPARTEYMVAPVVDEKWTTEDEVEVWAVCIDSWYRDTEISDIDLCTRDWKNDFGGGYLINPDNLADTQQAVTDVKQKYDLKSSANAKFIHWVEDPARELAGMVGVSIFTLVVFHLIYIISVLVKWKKIKATTL